MFAGTWSFGTSTGSTGSSGGTGTWSLGTAPATSTTTTVSGSTGAVAPINSSTGSGQTNDESDPRTKSDIIYLGDTPVERLTGTDYGSRSGGLKALALLGVILLLAKHL